jgi:glutamine synthetase
LLQLSAGDRPGDGTAGRLRRDELAAGYGDYVMKPDLSTLRPVPWLEGTAMVLCDMLDHHTHEPVPHSPRAVLKKQIARLETLGPDAMMATELEFFLFEKSFDEMRKDGFRDLSRSAATTRITTSSRPPRKRR